VRTIIVWLVKGYQMLLSPLFPFNHCRFIPSCSQYMVEAVEKHGARSGGWLGLKRLGRCHPFSKHGGFDPVP
jgi:putative membrane protein insertion efficiency factor